MNHPEPLTLNQAVKVSGLSRSTLKRRLPELESCGAYKLTSGEWRIPPAALTALVGGSDGSHPEPREPGSNEPGEPRRDPGEPREVHAGVSWEELAEARTAAREWQARAEERAERIEELAKRAEHAEARLDQMLANQTAMALTMKEQQHLLAQAPSPLSVPPEPEADHPPEPRLVEPDPTPSVDPEPAAGTGTLGGKVRRWFRG